MDVSIVSRKMFLAETFTNIGIVYQLLHNDSKTEYYLTKGYELAMQTKQNALIALASEHLSKYFRTKKQFESSLEFYEVFKQYSDSIYNEDNIKNITRLEMQYQFEGKLREAELSQLVNEQKRKRLNIIYLMVSIGLLLILTIVVLLLLLEKNKKRKIELEKKALTEKLDHTNKELTTYVMYLLRKNEFILSIIEKLKKAKLDAKPENKKVIAEMISELKSNTDTVSWDEFEVRFQEVHTDFYTNLRNKFPDLSTNEIRLCAFFKLNMTTKEIAAITYQSLNSIKVARYRLRKKLKLDQQDNLIHFLAQF
jgi:DNA-binding CsgD family transcriptional regulator